MVKEFSPTVRVIDLGVNNPPAIRPEYNNLRDELEKLKADYRSGNIPPIDYLVKLLELGYSGYWLRAAELGGPIWDDQKARKEAQESLGNVDEGEIKSERIIREASGTKGDLRRFRQGEKRVMELLAGLQLPPGFREATLWVFFAQTAVINMAERMEGHVTDLYSTRGEGNWPRYKDICGFLDRKTGAIARPPTKKQIRRAANGRFNTRGIAGVIYWSKGVFDRVENLLKTSFPENSQEVSAGLQKALTYWDLWRGSPLGLIAGQLASACDSALRSSLAALAKGEVEKVEEIWGKFYEYRINLFRERRKPIGGRSGPARAYFFRKEELFRRIGVEKLSDVVGMVLTYEEGERKNRRLVLDAYLSRKGYPRLLVAPDDLGSEIEVIGLKKINKLGGKLEPPTEKEAEIVEKIVERLDLLFLAINSPEIQPILEKIGLTPVGAKGLFVQMENSKGVLTYLFLGCPEVIFRLRKAGCGAGLDKIEEILSELRGLFIEMQKLY